MQSGQGPSHIVLIRAKRALQALKRDHSWSKRITSPVDVERVEDVEEVFLRHPENVLLLLPDRVMPALLSHLLVLIPLLRIRRPRTGPCSLSEPWVPNLWPGTQVMSKGAKRALN